MRHLHTVARIRCRLVVVATALLSIIISGDVNAVEKDGHESPNVVSMKRKSSGPYCGLYCLYSVMRLNGQSVDFPSLLKPEYISSPKGSSLAELKLAAEDHGFHAVAAGKMTMGVLRRCRSSVILHVKSRPDSREYDHYELCLGVENGKAKVFNPPAPAECVALYELAARCDGNGVIVSTQPIDLRALFAPNRRKCSACVTVATAGVVLVHYVRRRLRIDLRASWKRTFGLSVGQGIMLGVVALVLAFAYHFMIDHGFLAHTGTTEAIQQAHAGDFIPKVGATVVQRRLSRDDTIIVDARYEPDFKLGHVPGAINIPVDANGVRRQAMTASISKYSSIIVYCQSKACQFAENVAVWLQDNGFSDVVVYRGGWVDWVAKNGRKNTE